MTRKQLWYYIKSDLKFYGGKTFIKATVTYFTKPSFRLMLNYRLGSYFIKKKSTFFNLLVVRYRYIQTTKRNCQISYDAVIGERLLLSHPIGIVIGKGVVIEDDVSIWQNVTIGNDGAAKGDADYPLIKKGAKIYCGAVVAGKIIIGSNAVVGANAFVNKSIPDNGVGVGVPCRVIEAK